MNRPCRDVQLLERTARLKDDDVGFPKWDIVMHFDEPIVRLTFDECSLNECRHQGSFSMTLTIPGGSRYIAQVGASLHMCGSLP